MRMIGLEPPGNVAREIVLYRRRLFAALGEGSALAFPEIVPLRWLAPAARSVRHGLRGCWEGAEGPFSTTRPLLEGGSLYLGLSGPLEDLSRRIDAALADEGASARRPLAPGLGFFLCRHPAPEAAAEAALETALGLDPPSLRFLDCALVELRIRSGEDPFAGLAWRLAAREIRRTGAVTSARTLSRGCCGPCP